MKMCRFLIFLVFCIVSFVESTSQLEKGCANGPEYWCETIESSRKCNAFKFCVQTVWTKHAKYMDKVLTANNDAECNSCLECISGDFKNCPDNLKLQLDDFSELYLHEIPPKTICKLANGCQVKNTSEVETEADQCRSLHQRHWCDNFNNARKCKTIDQCRKNVWSKLPAMILAPLYETSDTVCGLCIWSFSQLHEILQRNTTEFNVEEYLKGTCELLPFEVVQRECVDNIEKNFADIYNMVRDNTDPGIICRVANVCKDEHLIEKQKDSEVDIRILNPQDTDSATSFNSEKKQNLLGSKTEVLVAQLLKSNGVGCELCSLILSSARFMRINGRSDSEIITFVKQEQCNRLGSLKESCESYIDIEASYILNDLTNGDIESSVLCQRMGLCLKIQVTSESTKRFYDINARDSNCTVCTNVLDAAKTMLDNKTSEDEILNYMRANLCEQAPKYEEMCKTVITAYGPVILRLLSNNLSPQQICTLIGFCGEHDTDQTNNVQDQNCILCEFVMTTLSKYITQNSSKAEVEMLLKRVCEKLPSTVRDECNEFVNEYEPMIADLIASKIKPLEICTKLGMCKKSFELNNSAVKEESKPECALCEFIMHLLGQYLQKNATKQEIDTWLNNVCDKSIPATLRDSCKQFVDDYEPIIVALLADSTSADKFCQLMHFCIGDFSNEVKTTINPEIYCEACEFSIKFIHYELKWDKSDERVKVTLENVCKIVPENIKEECVSIIETYGIYLINMIDLYMDPKLVCRKLKLCPIKNENAIKPIETQSVNQIEFIPLEPIFKKTEMVEASPDLISKHVPKETLQCSLCIYVAEVLNSLLKQNKTEQEIVAELEKLCRFFKSPLKDQCQSFIDQYGPYVLQLLANNFTPQEICYNMKVCPEDIETGLDALLK